jgi:DNA-damage-inducible protein J
MGQTEIIKIRIDSELKNDAEVLLNQLGLSTSGAINIFLRQVTLCGGLPFEVKLPAYNEETLIAMAEAKVIAKSGNAYDSEEEMYKELGI